MFYLNQSHSKSNGTNQDDIFLHPFCEAFHTTTLVDDSFITLTWEKNKWSLFKDIITQSLAIVY